MATFIEKDLKIIEREWNIILFEFRQNQKHLVFVDLIRQFFFLVSHLSTARRLVCMFGGYHSLLPSLFGSLFKKPVWIVLGGYDCYSFPDIKYGAFHKKWFGWIVGLSYKYADLLSPVHASMANEPYTYYDCGYPNQGFQYFVPNLRTSVIAINNGYEPEKFLDLHMERKPNSFLTVARDTAGATYFRKGIDLVFEVALLFPDFHFTIIGKNENQNLVVPGNIKFLPPVPYAELEKIYNSHEFYLQLSIAEGFPNALSEAMLCGCIPIGSNVFGIPDLVGNTGLILEKRDITLLKNILNSTQTLDKDRLSSMARERVSEKFNLKRRADKMLQVLREFVSK